MENLIELETVNCDLCGSNNYCILCKSRDYRFGRRQKYNIVKCNYCGLIYINPRPTSQSIKRLYEEDYTPENKVVILPKLEVKKLKVILKKFWHRVNGNYVDEILAKTSERVLDIGCGQGYFLQSLKAMGLDTYGVEINHQLVEICQELGLNVFHGSLEEIRFSDNFFNTIIMSQIIEHLPSPKKTLKEVFRVLKPSGKVFIYCPNANSYLSRLFGKYWHGWHLPFHFYAFTKDTIEKLAVETGFKINRISTITPDNFFIVSLKDYFFGEKNSNIRPIDRGKFFDSLFFRTVISPVFRLLDLLTQNGDCLKVELKK